MFMKNAVPLTGAHFAKSSGTC